MDNVQRIAMSFIGGAAGLLLGGPIGAVTGAGVGYFSKEIGGAAKAVLGNPIGGGMAGGLVGGIAGFALGGPIGALLGGTLGATIGGTIGSYFQMQEIQAQQQQALNYMMFNYGQGNQYMGYGMGMYAAGSMGFTPSFGLSNVYGGSFNMAMGAFSMNYDNSRAVFAFMQVNPQTAQQYPSGGTVKKNENGSVDYTSRGGWKVNVNGTTITLTDPSGEKTTKIWGDPHVKEADGSNWDWSSKTATFLLPDGTKITMNADSPNGVVKNTSIYEGGQQVQINNANNTFEASYDPLKTYQADAAQADGKTYTTQNLGNDWKQIYNQEDVNKPVEFTDQTQSSGSNTSDFLKKLLPLLPLLALLPLPILLILLMSGMFSGGQQQT
jgi:hypothetical protein